MAALLIPYLGWAFAFVAFTVAVLVYRNAVEG